MKLYPDRVRHLSHMFSGGLCGSIDTLSKIGEDADCTAEALYMFLQYSGIQKICLTICSSEGFLHEGTVAYAQIRPNREGEKDLVLTESQIRQRSKLFRKQC